MSVQFLQGDVRTVLATLPDESVHCVCTSPPYWNLRDYGVPGQIGLEPTLAEYVATLVDVFRQVRRVMRKDATLWLNLGDSYAGSGKGPSNSMQPDAAQSKQTTNRGSLTLGRTPTGRNPAQFQNGQAPTTWAPVPRGLKPKDLCMVPARVAIALQDDGWWLRSDIAWVKLSAMPESVQDRPTSAWEHIFLLTRSERYFYDADAVKQTAATEDPENPSYRANGKSHKRTKGLAVPPGACGHSGIDGRREAAAGANLRNWWALPPEPLRAAHFAAFPSEIPRRAILAGTSEKGCCAACGAPWRRVVEKSLVLHQRVLNAGKYESRPFQHAGSNRQADGHIPGHNETTTTGWAPTCAHDAPVVPCVVLDPFAGAGTTVLAADRLERHGLGIELSPAYADLATRRVYDDAPLLAAIEGAA